jgi:EmrB/QacA subfamily drug resistance transporter
MATLQRDLHTTQNTVTWVLTAYLLTASVATPILGRLGDRFGKHKMLVVSLAALAAGAALAAVVNSIGLLIVARAIQGIGGGTMPIAFGIVRDERPPELVGRTIGFLAAVLAVGGGVGIVVAGPLDDAIGYHWLFGGVAIVIAAAIGMTMLFVPESPIRAAGRIGSLPALLLSAALICLLLGISEAARWGWVSLPVVTLVASGLTFAFAWMRAELRASHPLIDMRMMRLPVVWSTNLVSFAVGAAIYCMVAFLPQFLQTGAGAGYGFGASITQSGLILLPQSVVMFIAGSSTGPVIARFGGRTLMLLACLLIGGSFLWLAVAHDTVAEFVLGSSVMGAGVGLSFAGMTTIVIQAVPLEQTGAASGMNANIRTMGGALGTSVISLIITAHPEAHSGVPREAGYVLAFVVIACVMLVGAGVCALIPGLNPGEARRAGP